MAKTKIEHYRAQHGNCRRRGIEFTLTFEEWSNWWIQTGCYSQRGRSPGQYSMSRIDITQGFHLGNIQLTQNPHASDNFWYGSRRTQAVRHNRRIARARRQPVQTPRGLFSSLKQAARKYRLSTSGMRWRILNHPKDYYYIT